MGFSPTIYASADRPYLYLYFVLIYVCADAVWNMGGMKAVWKTGSSDAVRKMPVPEKLMFTVLGLLVLANILDVTRMWLAAWKDSVTVINRTSCFMQET